MRNFLIAFSLLFLAACSRDAEVLPLNQIELDADDTYVVVARPISDLKFTYYLFCEPSDFGRYTIQVNAIGGGAGCRAPAAGTIIASGNGVGWKHYKLSDDLTVTIRRLKKGSLLEPMEIPGTPLYLAGSVNTTDKKVNLNTGRVMIHTIRPRTIHVLGTSKGYGGVVWEVPDGIAEALARNLPLWAQDRVVVERPKFAKVACSGDFRESECSTVSVEGE